MTKEDKIQVALGLKFQCSDCKTMRDRSEYIGTWYGATVCSTCFDTKFSMDPADTGTLSITIHRKGKFDETEK